MDINNTTEISRPNRMAEAVDWREGDAWLAGGTADSPVLPLPVGVVQDLEHSYGRREYLHVAADGLYDFPDCRARRQVHDPAAGWR